MGMMKDGVTLRHSLAIFLAELLRHVGIVNHREDVHEQSLAVVEREVLIAFHIEGVEVAHLHNRFSCVLRLGSLQAQTLTQLFRSNLHKAPHVLKRHGNVDVVVPRDEAAVTHRTKQRATVQPVADGVFAADAVDFLQNGELLQLRTSQLRKLKLFEIIHRFHTIISFQPFFSRQSPDPYSLMQGCEALPLPHVRA